MVALLSTLKKVTPNVKVKRPKGIRKKSTLPSSSGDPASSSSIHPAAPKPGDIPEVILRVQVVGCSELASKDKNGKSDPFVVVTLGSERYTTPVIKKTLNPEYDSKNATFDFALYRSTVGHVGALQFVVWDKDLMSKDYLGEIALSFEELFKHQHHELPSPAFAFDDERNTEFALAMDSSRKNTQAQGMLRLKIGYAPVDEGMIPDYRAVHKELQQAVNAAGLSLMSAPPTRGIGTAALDDSDIEDDGLSSGDEYSTDDAETPDTSPSTSAIPSRKATLPPPIIAPQPQYLKPTVSSGLIPKILSPIRPTLSPQMSGDGSTITPEGSRPSSRAKKLRPQFKRTFNSDYNFATNMNDTVGIVMLEINGAHDLPKLKNLTRTGWDMDPFCVISFGKKVFRTRVIRHSLNPAWNEKLLFHVHRYETSFRVSLRVLDWDKLSGNDYIGGADFNLSELMANVPQPDPNTGLYSEEVTQGQHDMTEYKLPITTDKGADWEYKHAPILVFRAKYQPYRALRQRFWRQYLRQYDADGSGFISHLEMTTMLDTLGSTLSASTIDSFFTRFGLKPREEELSFDQAVQCLEDAVTKPQSERKTVDEDALLPHTGTNTPLLQGSPGHNPNLGLYGIEFSGPSARPPNDEAIESATRASWPDGNTQKATNRPISLASSYGEVEQLEIPSAAMARTTSEMTVQGDATPIGSWTIRAGNGPFAMGSNTSVDSSELQKAVQQLSEDIDDAEGSPLLSGAEEMVERVINIKTCPLCHRPRMNRKAETDIVTHLAVCASSDWARVDRMIVGNYVTASQAQRKWYSTVVTKISAGTYQLGANSANIIVQNRLTGQLEEEKMQGYVRFGIRLLYKGAKSRMEGGRARRLLKSLSVKQGQKFDSPESAREIMPFIAFHCLPIEEILDPLDSFKTFNEFFYRKLKMKYRPMTEPDNPRVAVSVADCRMMAFETVHEATKIWIKGKDFTVAKLLGEHYSDDASRYNGGALGVFRLAPQDYHRFHVPVDGKIGPMHYISGEYYTVNPQAIRTTLDVYGENARKIVPIDSPSFGRVMAVCVGAMMVGSIITTVDEGQEVKRGDEFGYFAFGGSTIVLLFEKGVLQWDEDIVSNSQAALETLVRVRMGVGKAVKPTLGSRSSSASAGAA